MKKTFAISVLAAVIAGLISYNGENIMYSVVPAVFWFIVTFAILATFLKTKPTKAYLRYSSITIVISLLLMALVFLISDKNIPSGAGFPFPLFRWEQTGNVPAPLMGETFSAFFSWRGFLLNLVIYFVILNPIVIFIGSKFKKKGNN